MSKRNTKIKSKNKKRKKSRPLKVGNTAQASDPMANAVNSGTSFVGKDLAGLGFAIGTVAAVNLVGSNNAFAQSSGVCTGGAASFCSVCSVCTGVCTT